MGSSAETTPSETLDPSEIGDDESPAHDAPRSTRPYDDDSAVREVLPSIMPPAYTLPPPDAGLAEVVEPDSLVPPSAEPADEAPSPGRPTPLPAVHTGPRHTAPPPGEKVTTTREKASALPSMNAVAALVGQNQWQKVCELLGSPEHHGRLPAPMAFVYGLALNEIRVPGSAVDRQAPDIEAVTRASVAALLNADEGSDLVRIITRRLLKRGWTRAPAPPRRTSILLIVAAVMLGTFIGFLIGPGRDWFRSM